MKRNAFTMVELIFVIVIIGVLAATALPKFGGVRDNASASSEIAAMSSLNGAIAAAVEFRLQDFKDSNVSWHGDVVLTGSNYQNRATEYINKVNAQKKVLKTILDKGDKFRIISAVSSTGSNTRIYNGPASNASYEILFITGEASDRTNGLTASANDILGKPDKNDAWCFNPNSFDINVTDNDTNKVVGPEGNYVIVPAYSVKLIDVNGTDEVYYYAIDVGNSGYPQGAIPLEMF